MNNYEAMYIVYPSVDDETRQQVIDRFSGIVTSGGGNVEEIDDWGKRKLAYEIEDLTEGHYILMHFTADANIPHELERHFRISDHIMRYMVVRKDG